MRKTHFILLGLCLLMATPAAAQRTNPLDGQPSVRRRLLLRDNRFEVRPEFGVTLNRDFYHTLLGGVHLEYHINDYFSIGGMFAGGAYNMPTGLKANVRARLPDPGEVDPRTPQNQLVPTKAEAEASMLKLKYVAGGQLTATPFFGKLALFSKLFFNYDFYLFGGFGLAGFDDDCAATGECVYTDEKNREVEYSDKGMKMGGTFGAGFHLFANNWVAINFELRDTVVRDNIAGRDTNWDPIKSSDEGACGKFGSSVPCTIPPRVNADDRQFDHVFAFLFGISFYLPTAVDISK